MKASTKKNASKVVSIVNIDNEVNEYFLLREQKKIIDARMKVLSTNIKNYTEKNGVKNDTGSFYCDNDSYIFGRQIKKSVTLNVERAIAFLKKHKLGGAIVVTESVDESVVEKYVADGTISYEELESMTDTNTTFALDLKKKEEMPMVNETKVIAAKRKPILKGRK